MDILKAQGRVSNRAAQSEQAANEASLNKKFEQFDALLDSIETGEGFWNFSDKTHQEVYDLFGKHLRENKYLWDWLSEAISSKISPKIAKMNPEGLTRMQNYSAWGLLLITEIAKSYQGKHLSDRDMKSYLAVLPEMQLLGTREGIKIAKQRMRDLKKFFASSAYQGASETERGTLIFNYAVENKFANADTYREGFEFSDEKQVIYETAKLAQATKR